MDQQPRAEHARRPGVSVAGPRRCSPATASSPARWQPARLPEQVRQPRPRPSRRGAPTQASSPPRGGCWPRWALLDDAANAYLALLSQHCVHPPLPVALNCDESKTRRLLHWVFRLDYWRTEHDVAAEFQCSRHVCHAVPRDAPSIPSVPPPPHRPAARCPRGRRWKIGDGLSAAGAAPATGAPSRGCPDRYTPGGPHLNTDRVDGISTTVHPWVATSRPIVIARPGSAHGGRRLPHQARAGQPVVVVRVRWLRDAAAAAAGGAKPWLEERPGVFVEVRSPLGPPARAVLSQCRCRRPC
jgi:hypothetical protein